MQEKLAELKIENKKLLEEHQTDQKELAALSENFDASIQDRDRVIKHKTGQISDLVLEKKKLEAALHEEQTMAKHNWDSLNQESSQEIRKLDAQLKDLKEELDKYETYKTQKEAH